MKPTISFLAALLLAPFAVCDVTHATQAKQPNVLLIITDDQGYGDFSIHGNPHLQTPHIDKLGRESVRYDRLYVNSFCALHAGGLAYGAMAAADLLATKPKNVGIDNSTEPVAWGWWALAKGGRSDVVVKELREVYGAMNSVRLNNSIEEFYGGSNKPDTPNNWSHICCAPLYVAVMSLAGIRLLEPAFQRYEIRPQLADLPDLALTVHTPHGPIGFSGKGPLGNRTLSLTLPPNAAGELVVHRDEQLALKLIAPGRYALPAGQTVNIELKHT
jgi:hypothetical protein